MQPGDQEVTISVRNEGPAIPPADRERIFERFYRANPSHRGPPGAGLGLPIVRRIVEAHHGRVWFESQNGITVFFLALPLAPALRVSSETSALAQSSSLPWNCICEIKKCCDT